MNPDGPKLQDIGIGADGSVWAVGQDKTIWKYENYGEWVLYPGAALRVSVDSQGIPWVIGSTETFWRWQETAWVQIPGSGIDIGVGANDVVYAVGKQTSAPFRFNHATQTWTQVANGKFKNIAAGPDGFAWVTSESNEISRQSGLHWKQLPGAAVDIGAGADGTVYAVGTQSVPNGGAIYRWQYQSMTWHKISDAHGAARIDVDPKGNPYIVDNKNNIFYWDSLKNKFIQMPDQATDIAVGADGSVWIIGVQTASGGYNIRYWDSAKEAWVSVSGAAVRITVDFRGVPWVVNSGNNIYRWNGKSWTQTTGKAVDIGAGADGSIYITDKDGKIFRYIETTGQWAQIEGSGAQVTADACGKPWVINSAGAIYQRFDDCNKCEITPIDTFPFEELVTIVDVDASNIPRPYWEFLSGEALDIGVSTTGDAWVIGLNQGIYYWTEKTLSWTKVDGAAVRIAVGPDNIPYVVNRNNNVYRWNGRSWTQLSGSATDVGVGADGSVFIISTDQNVYQYQPTTNTWTNYGASGTRIAVDKFGRPWIVNSN